jgi:hypothetical protein
MRFVRLPFANVLADPAARNWYEVNPAQVVLVQEIDDGNCNIWFSFSASPWLCRWNADQVKGALGCT